MDPGRFRAWRAVREAWSLIGGTKRVYVAMSVTVWAVGTLVRLALWVLMHEQGAPAGQAVDAGLIDLSFAFGLRVEVLGFEVSPGAPAVSGTQWSALAPAAAGLVTAVFGGAFAAYALRRAEGLPVWYGMLLRYGRYAPSLVGLQLVAIGLGAALGYVLVALLRPAADLLPSTAWATALFAVPVVASIVFLDLALMFAGLYVVDRDLGPFAALGRSVTLSFHNLGQTALLWLVALVAELAGSLTLGIASVWLAPLAAVAQGCAFRDAVGVHTAGEPLPLDAVPGRPALGEGA